MWVRVPGTGTSVRSSRPRKTVKLFLCAFNRLTLSESSTGSPVSCIVFHVYKCIFIMISPSLLHPVLFPAQSSDCAFSLSLSFVWMNFHVSSLWRLIFLLTQGSLRLNSRSDSTGDWEKGRRRRGRGVKYEWNESESHKSHNKVVNIDLPLGDDNN